VRGGFGYVRALRDIRCGEYGLSNKLSGHVAYQISIQMIHKKSCVMAVIDKLVI